MSYLGSKAGSGVYQAIISQFPPHDVFIDAFFGSGAITRLKPPAAKTYAIDLDPGCIDNFVHAGQHEMVLGDCRSFIADFDYTAAGRTLIYCDPPYLHSTRGKARYKHEFSDDDHIELLNLLRTVPADIVISGYPSCRYDELLHDWRTIEFQAMTRGGIRTEKLWMNFPEESVHWHTYAGKNFTERQRIKRKAQRWASNFQSLPESERLAVLSAILGTM